MVPHLLAGKAFTCPEITRRRVPVVTPGRKWRMAPLTKQRTVSGPPAPHTKTMKKKDLKKIKKQLRKLDSRIVDVEYDAHNVQCDLISHDKEMRREIAILHERLDGHARVVDHLLKATGAFAILDAKIRDAIDRCEKTEENDREAQRTRKSLSALRTDIDKMIGDAATRDMPL